MSENYMFGYKVRIITARLEEKVNGYFRGTESVFFKEIWKF